MHETHPLGTSELVLGHAYEAGRLYWATFLSDVVSRGLPHERHIHWDTTASNLDCVREYATHSSKLTWGSAALLDLEGDTGCIAVVSITAGGAIIHLAAETVAALDDGESFLRQRLPERVPTEDQTVPISFWSYGSCGPSETSRSIDVPTWADICGNYPPRVADQLEALMRSEYRPGGRGAS
jgi:hypothetical protein